MHAVADGFATAGLDVQVEVRGDVSGLPAAVEVAALRVATEALHNAARHPGARGCGSGWSAWSTPSRSRSPTTGAACPAPRSRASA